MTGIKLDFKDGKARIKRQKLPLCMGWIPCENLVERVEIEHGVKIHYQICKILNKSVHQIFDEICTTKKNPCPRGIWFSIDEDWYYLEKKQRKAG